MHMLRNWQVPRCGLSLCVSWRGEIGGAADDELAPEPGIEALLEVHLDAVEIHGRQELAIGELRHALDAAADAREDFRLVVPRRDFFITHRPGDGHALFRIGLEVHGTEAVTLARPH